jgi:RNA polymerase sigma-70 factor (ECF subfamily)
LKQPEYDELDLVLRDFGTSVWRLVVRIVGNDGHDAADCFQQAFVELASRRRQSKDVRHIEPLLKRIAAARAIDVVRRRIRERARSPECDVGLLASPRQFEPDVRAETDEFLDALRSGLSGLPKPQAVAFVLTQIEDMPHNEAAEAIGVTVNHLRVLLHRARTALRARLQSHNPIQEIRP